MIKVEIAKVKLSDVKINPDNPRTITEQDMQRLTQSLRDFPDMMQLREIVVDETMTVLGGNMRLLALQQMGEDGCTVKIVSGLTREQKREFIIKDNAVFGEWIMDDLANTWSDLPLVDWGVDLPKHWENLEDWKKEDKEKDILGVADDDLENMGSVFDLKADVKFNGIGIFDFPEIKKEMILDIENLTTWAGPNATKTNPPYLYNYATDSTIGLDFSQTVISFYTDDSRFERVWEKTREITKMFLNKNIIGCVTPNFSTYFTWPKALRIYNIFRSRWVGRYFQEAGIRIIPDITCGMGDIDCVCDGIPENMPISMQAHRKYHNIAEIKEKNLIIETVCEKLNPSKIWLYATEDRLDMFPCLAKYKVELLTPRTILQAKEKKRRGRR